MLNAMKNIERESNKDLRDVCRCNECVSVLDSDCTFTDVSLYVSTNPTVYIPEYRVLS